MSHSTHVKDESGKVWVIFHNSDWSGDCHVRLSGNPIDEEITVPGFIIKNACRAVLAEELTTLVQDSVEFALSAWQSEAEATRVVGKKQPLTSVHKDVSEAVELLRHAVDNLNDDSSVSCNLNVAKANIYTALNFITAAMKEEKP